MSTDENLLLKLIKRRRRSIDVEPSDAEDNCMTTSSRDRGSCNDDSPVPERNTTLVSEAVDSGICDPSTVTADSDGTSTNKPTDKSESGRYPDCVCEVGPQKHVELTSNGLETGLYNTMSPITARKCIFEIGGNETYDFSTNVNADSSVLCREETSRRTCDKEFPELPRELQGELHCDIFYVNETSGTLHQFKTFNELSEYLVNAAVQVRVRSRSRDFILKKLVKLPLEATGVYISIGEYLRFLYEEDKLMDVAIHVKDNTFYAHRVALSCYSQYFADLFSSNMGKRIPFEMRLKGINPEAFAVFLEFIYTGQLTVHDSIAADLIIIADFLKVDSLKQRCSVLSDSLPLDQSLKLVVKCRGGTSGQVYNTVLHRCMKNFSEVAKLPGILEMDIDTLCEVLASDDLFVASEYEAFQVAVRWLAHNIEERIKYAMRILNLIRFQYMTQNELFTCAETTSLIRTYDKFREAILIASWLLTARQLKRDDPFRFPIQPPRKCYMVKFSQVCQQSPQPGPSRMGQCLQSEPTLKLCSPVDQPLTSTPTPLPSTAKHGKPVMVPKELQTQAKVPPKAVDILVVGGFQTEGDKFVERYDIEDNQWVHFCCLPEPRIRHAVALLGNLLYLIGGCDPSKAGDKPLPTTSVYALNISTKDWKKVSSMSVARMNHSACCLLGQIYAIGGQGLNNNTLGSVECYNPQTDNWFFLSPLVSARAASSASILGDKIFVVGGLTEDRNGPAPLQVLNSVEVFDPKTNSWSSKSSLRFPRCHASLVNAKERLFLCGGATRSYDYKNSVLISVAAVDEYIEAHDMWCHRTDMIIPRHDAGVTVAGDRIYIVGGISSTADRVLQSVECYDTRQALWLSGVQDLPYPTRWICCVSILSKYHKPNPLNLK